MPGRRENSKYKNKRKGFHGVQKQNMFSSSATNRQYQLLLLAMTPLPVPVIMTS